MGRASAALCAMLFLACATACAGQLQACAAAGAAAGEAVAAPAPSQHVMSVMRHLGVTPEAVWNNLLRAHSSPGDAVAVEVGSYDGHQCRLAYDYGFGRVACFEPSPPNYERARSLLESSSGALASGRVALEQLAVGNSSGGSVEFHALPGGGTGDHAGALNPGEVEATAGAYARSAAVQVPLVALDDYFANLTGEIYLVKIDVQGFDGTALQGMRSLLAARRVRYIIAELWPSAMERATPCEDALRLLLEAGYQVFELGLNVFGSEPLPSKEEQFQRPTDVGGLCEWYRKHSGSFGLWTDVLAVSSQLQADASGSHAARSFNGITGSTQLQPEAQGAPAGQPCLYSSPCLVRSTGVPAGAPSVHDVQISNGDRASLLAWIAKQRAQGPFTVIDVGASMVPWTIDVADAYADFQTPARKVPDNTTFFEVDLNMPCTWTAALEHVAKHGKFDFSVCSHTLEDLSCPKCAVDFLQRISKAGFIAVPSKYRESARFENPTMPWRGYIHHKWVFDVRGGQFIAYPKVALFEYLPEADALANVDYNVMDLSFRWTGFLPYREVNNGFLGPTASHVIEYYRALRG